MSGKRYKIISGRKLFYWKDTKGVPIELSLAFAKSRGFIFDWLEYLSECINHGQNNRRATDRLEQAVYEVYGKAFGDGCRERFNMVRETYG